MNTDKETRRHNIVCVRSGHFVKNKIRLLGQDWQSTEPMVQEFSSLQLPVASELVLAARHMPQTNYSAPALQSPFPSWHQSSYIISVFRPPLMRGAEPDGGEKNITGRRLLGSPPQITQRGSTSWRREGMHFGAGDSHCLPSSLSHFSFIFFLYSSF